MTVASGTAGSVLVGTVEVGRVSEWSMNVQRKIVEISGMGEGWQQFIAGIAGATGSFSLAGDPADAGQIVLKAAALGAGTVALYLYEGTALWTIGTAVISGPKAALSFDGASKWSYDFTADGTVS